jgi:hypothetical protein
LSNFNQTSVNQVSINQLSLAQSSIKSNFQQTKRQNKQERTSRKPLGLGDMAKDMAS